MIRGEHACIRTTEPDDASAFYLLYRGDGPRAALLDPRREPLQPTASECAEMIASRQATQGTFFTIEDPTGDIRGFVNLRGLNQETPFCEVSLLLIDPEDYQTPLAHAAFDFAADRVFVRHRLLKIMAIALEEEVAWRAFLTARGFQGSGVQREVLFTAGRYRNLESYALFEEDYQPHAN